jgi:hypothetical protein
VERTGQQGIELGDRTPVKGSKVVEAYRFVIQVESSLGPKKQQDGQLC